MDALGDCVGSQRGISMSCNGFGWVVVAVVLLLSACAEPSEQTAGAGDEASAGTASGSTVVDDGCAHTFVFHVQGESFASEVLVAGNFESLPWGAGLSLRDEDGDGFWTGEQNLLPGTYEYRLVVNGTWTPDPANPEFTINEFGDRNSVFEHTCPFEPLCITDAQCDETAPLCRGYQCMAQEPCYCGDGSSCDALGICGEAQCGPERACSEPLVCEDGVCVPECVDDAECAGASRCIELECVDPECAVDIDCPDILSQTCLDHFCEDDACGMHTFLFNPEGANYTSVHVAGSFNGWPATREEGGFDMTWEPSLGQWYAKAALDDGQYSYKYVGNDGEFWMPDSNNPWSEVDGFGSANSLIEVACVGVNNCGPTDDFLWDDAVMYFALVDRFFDGDGATDSVGGVDGTGTLNGPNGNYVGGDLEGMTSKLPYLAELGVSALWLSAPFENRDAAGDAIDPSQDSHNYTAYHGYWPSPDNIDYSNMNNPTPRPSVESRIGTEQSLHGLVDTAHTTQTADGHNMKVMFDYVMNHVDLDSGLYAAHPEWFAREGDRFRLCGPENLWEDDYWGTRCAFTDYLPPFEFGNDDARAWSVNDALWWAQNYDIDGYRLDAIKHVPMQWLEDLRSSINENILEPRGERFYLVGETFNYGDRDLLASFVDPETKLDGQFDFPFKAQLCNALFSQNLSLSEFAYWMDGNDDFYGPGAIMTTWIGNHDVPRAIHFASGQIQNCMEGSSPANGWTMSYGQPQDASPYERLALAYVVMMTSPGIPLIYYGDEIGLAGGGDPDNRRAMPWNDGDLLAAQLDLRTTLSRLGTIRGEEKSLTRGSRYTLHADADTWVYRMDGCGDAAGAVWVAINRSDESKTVAIPSGSYVDLMTQASTGGGQQQLGPRDFIILRQE